MRRKLTKSMDSRLLVILSHQYFLPYLVRFESEIDFDLPIRETLLAILEAPKETIQQMTHFY